MLPLDKQRTSLKYRSLMWSANMSWHSLEDSLVSTALFQQYLTLAVRLKGLYGLLELDGVLCNELKWHLELL